MRAALILALLAATPASAACHGDEAFSCQIGQKTLELCYWKGMLVKCEIALVKGKQQHDKRTTEKDRDWNREKQRVFRNQ